MLNVDVNVDPARADRALRGESSIPGGGASFSLSLSLCVCVDRWLERVRFSALDTSVGSRLSTLDAHWIPRSGNVSGFLTVVLFLRPATYI